jgi:hypothetical protein
MIRCKTPCKECPFTKTSVGGWFGNVYESAEELHTLIMNEAPFSCHMAQKDFVSFDEVGSEGNPFCAGALMYMKKAGKSPKYNSEIRTLVDQIDRSELDNILLVPEFFKHHEKVISY